MAKRMSRRRLVLLFIVSLLVGIALRYAVLPPGTILSASEEKLVGSWTVTSGEGEQLWQFEDNRDLTVLQKDETKLWDGNWRVNDDKLSVEAEKPLNVRIQFADTPDKFTMFADDGQQQAKRVR